MPAAESYQKGLGNDVVGRAIAEPSGDVAVDRSSVPIIKLGECLGLMPGLLDQRGVVRAFSGWRSHASLRSTRSATTVTHYYPNRENRFTTLWRGLREHAPLRTVAQNRTISALRHDGAESRHRPWPADVIT
jgi:hypothetical protein